MTHYIFLASLVIKILPNDTLVVILIYCIAFAVILKLSSRNHEIRTISVNKEILPNPLSIFCILIIILMLFDTVWCDYSKEFKYAHEAISGASVLGGVDANGCPNNVDPIPIFRFKDGFEVWNRVTGHLERFSYATPHERSLRRYLMPSQSLLPNSTKSTSLWDCVGNLYHRVRDWFSQSN